MEIIKNLYKNLGKKGLILLIYSVLSTIVFTVTVSRNLFIILVPWYLIGMYAFFSAKNAEKNAVFLITILYPLYELAIKIIINYNLIPRSWFWINRVEHFTFSMLLTILIYIIVKAFKPLIDQKFLALVFSFLFMNFFGILNEIYEFILRYMWNLENKYYYSDTILDLITNLVGSFFAIAVLFIFFSKKKQITKKSI